MLDYRFYNQENKSCSDEIETDILNSLERGLTAEELLKTDERWQVFYRLSPIRENLLAWYPFEKDASVLEIGSGCGAVTGILCKKTDCVDAVEPSEIKSKINDIRNQKNQNLHIYVCELEDLKTEKTYDYVTLIGVLEHAGRHIHTLDPYVDMLRLAKRYLKPNGKLIIAIENKFGMKYWSGAREDHTGRYFEGIAGYENTKDIRTFSKNELEEMFKEAGFGTLKFYYPLPDYKIPQTIFSEGYLPKTGELRNVSTTYDMDRLQIFKEDAVYDSICRDGMFEYFANSFLVFADSEGEG